MFYKLINISLKFVLRRPLENYSALVLEIAWCHLARIVVMREIHTSPFKDPVVLNWQSYFSQGTVPISDKMSYCKILQSQELSDLYLELYVCFEIWHASWQQCCQCACQISKWYDDLNYQSRSFKTSPRSQNKTSYRILKRSLVCWPLIPRVPSVCGSVFAEI